MNSAWVLTAEFGVLLLIFLYDLRIRFNKTVIQLVFWFKEALYWSIAGELALEILICLIYSWYLYNFKISPLSQINRLT